MIRFNQVSVPLKSYLWEPEKEKKQAISQAVASDANKYHSNRSFNGCEYAGEGGQLANHEMTDDAS